jgi:hypothetical protein
MLELPTWIPSTISLVPILSSFVSRHTPKTPITHNRYYSRLACFHRQTNNPDRPPLISFPAQHSLPRRLSDGLISVAVVPLLTVRKKPVDDDTADGEDEDEDRPHELVADGAAGFEDLDWKNVMLAHWIMP